MINKIDNIMQDAEDLVKHSGTRDPRKLAELLHINVSFRHFQTLKGVYRAIDSRNSYIFLNESLSEDMQAIVLAHEIGHHVEHRKINISFQEINLFEMTTRIMEYEANYFAAQILLPDEPLLEYIQQSYTAEQIAKIMHSDPNLVALKVKYLCKQGYPFQVPAHKADFL